MRISDWSSDVCSSDLRFFIGCQYGIGAELAEALWMDWSQTANTMPLCLNRAGGGACLQWRVGPAFQGLDFGLQRGDTRHGPLQKLRLHIEFFTRDQIHAGKGLQIGRAHVRTPVTNAHLVCRRQL